MKKHSADIIIIGAGAAGLMAGIGAAQTLNGQGKVLIIEKMPKAGRKIMITGKGRCNFTNVKPWNDFSSHIHPKPNFLKPAFHNLNSEKMLDFFRENGMESVVERGDRAFPASHLASDVVDTLVKAAGKAGTDIIYNTDITKVTFDKNQTTFRIESAEGDTFTCSRLIICTGGLSYPKTGSTGDGYRWAADLGHAIKPLFPSLTAIVPAGYKSSDLSEFPDSKGHIDRRTSLSEYGRMLCGNELKNINISVVIDGNTAQEEFGDVQFTDGGMEGPVGFKVSRKCVNAIINGSRVQIIMDLKPAVERDALYARIIFLWNEICSDRRNAARQYKDRFRILLGKVMPMSLIPAFIKANPNCDHQTLAKVLKSWRFDIEGYVGYERCVITAGGVSCEEIVPKTLESRLIPGLYFAGEILDLDADTGGYNLQTAFSTGFLSGICAAKSIR